LHLPLLFLHDVLPISFFSRPDLSAYDFSVRVSPRRKPATCVPPSIVLILFTYECTFSVYVSLYCRASSTGTPDFIPSTCIGSGINGWRVPSRYFTNSLNPPSEKNSSLR